MQADDRRGWSGWFRRAPLARHDASPEPQSLVVRLELDEDPPGGGSARWRGHVTHIPSKERYYIRSLNAIPLIAALYLQLMGAQLGFVWRIRCWNYRRCSPDRLPFRPAGPVSTPTTERER